jgi:hypothetical protein
VADHPVSESTSNALGIADPLAPVRYLDVVLIVLAAPFVVLLDLPLLGYAVGTIVWIAARVLEAVLEQSASRGDVRRAIGVRVGSMVGRTWLIAVGILAVGLAGEREDGFTAALLCLAAYTVHLATALILRPLERNPEHP